MSFSLRASSIFGFSVIHACFLLFLCCFRLVKLHLRSQKIRSGSCLNLCKPLPRPQISFGRFVRSRIWTLRILSMNLTNFDPHRQSSSRQRSVQICARSPGHVNVFQWNWECFFFLHVELNSKFDVMTMNEVSFKVIADFSVIFCFLSAETCPSFLEVLLWDLYSWQVVLALERILGFAVPSAIGKENVHLFWRYHFFRIVPSSMEFCRVQHCQLRNVCNR